MSHTLDFAFALDSGKCLDTGGTSYSLAYDALDRLVKDSIDSNNNEHSAYDASGTRTLRRTVSGGTPTLTVYAFGLEEHTYSANGTLQNNTYYYSLNGRLIGELTGLTTQTTNMLLTDPLGSVLATFSNTAGSAALSGNQAYGPYGHLRYNVGGLSGMATSKGFTGQYSDAFSGLDYYDSRYYQPAVGIFLSADSKEGNTMGMDPYMYVGGNPETYNDPTGEFYGPPSQGNGNSPPTCQQVSTCWSSSGGSGHPPTNGNGSGGTTKTQVKLSGDCSGLTAQQCATAQSEKQNSLSSLHTEITVFQLLFGGLTLAADFTQLVLDLRKGLENIFSIIGDAVGILADITSLFSTAVTDFGWTSLQKAADEASLVSNSISSVWKTVRGFIDNGWGSFLATSIEFLGEGIEGLLKMRLVRVAIALPFALLAGILQWVGNSTHNDLLWWTGMVISCMLGSLVIITLVLIVVIRERQKAREQERQKPFHREQRKIPRQVEAIAQDVEGKISAEDWRLIEANQLGAPVGRYGVRQSAIGVFRWSSLGVIFGGLVILLLAGTHIFTFSDASFLSSFAPRGIGLLSVLVGIATLPVSLILLPKQCVLVCENGFLQRKNTRSRIVRWNDIWAIRGDSLLSEIYYLDLQTGKGVALGSYEHLDELVALIRQRSGLA